MEQRIIQNGCWFILKQGVCWIVMGLFFLGVPRVHAAEDSLALIQTKWNTVVGKFSNLIANFNAKDANSVVLVSAWFPESTTGTVSRASAATEDFSNVAAEIINTPLIYPNPFRMNSDSGAVLSYYLSKDFTFELHIYDMLAQRLFKQTYQSGSLGARRGENRLQFNKESLGGELLSSGVYFFVFIRDQKVLSKGKMVVKP